MRESNWNVRFFKNVRKWERNSDQIGSSSGGDSSQSHQQPAVQVGVRDSDFGLLGWKNRPVPKPVDMDFKVSSSLFLRQKTQLSHKPVDLKRRDANSFLFHKASITIVK